MGEQAEFTVEEGGSGRRVVLSGPLRISTVAGLDKQLRQFSGGARFVDLSQVSVIDTVGAWSALRFAREQGAEITGASRQAQILIEAVEGARSDAEIEPPTLPLAQRVPEHIGKTTVEMGDGVLNMVSFFGTVLVAIGKVLRHPSTFRMKAFVRQLELVGIASLGIIGLMSFLIGIVIAQQGAVQLEQFGAEILTINLVGRLTLRELGVLMTAIMIAGRSGSAFAAQIGTMKLTEEIDAMRTIGVSPIEALVLPRVFASLVMMPLLGFYASIMGIAGGAFISEMTLDIPFTTFIQRIREVVPIHDLWVGLAKGPVFGLIVAMTGCYQGLRVTGNSEQVGFKTTLAVVQAIFMVIVLDAFFAVFFSEVGWG